jgi:predicted aminopeptidase
VDAFSTLGWFRDPIYSYMRDYSEKDLAELIIHELFHSTVWLKHHVQFNEQLAQFVGVEGARLYIERAANHVDADLDDDHADTDAAAASAARQADRLAYLAFIQELAFSLENIYKSDITKEEKLAQKTEAIAAAKTAFEINYDNIFATDAYRFFTDLPINNAYLDLVRLYHEEDNYLQNLFENTGSDLLRIIAAAKTLPPRLKRGANPRAELENALGL